MKPKAKTLIERHGFVDPDRKSSKHDEIQLWVYENIVEVLRSFTSANRSFEIYSKQLEYPIIQVTPNYKNIIGFIDLRVEGRSFACDHAGKVKDEMRFTASIEIKTEIPSCGELLRQLNFYKRFETNSSTWIVVSPDDRFEQTLKEQGIYLYPLLRTTLIS